VAKALLYGCRDCGDSSLAETGFLCPESQCAKNQRNGPCGGIRNGRCEVNERHCIWVRAYYGARVLRENGSMLKRPRVVKDGLLQGTSAWANTFMGRDHTAIAAPRAATPPSRRGDQAGRMASNTSTRTSLSTLVTDLALGTDSPRSAQVNLVLPRM